MNDEEKKGNKERIEKKEPEKMTIYEYEDKYVKRQNTKGARLILFFFAAIIGVFLAWCLISATIRLWEIHEYAGYAATAVSVALYIFVYIVPIAKIYRTDYFQTNVNSKHAASAKRHNRRVRRNIAEKMVEFNAQVDGAGWYDDKLVAELEFGLRTNDDERIKRTLSALYSGKVKKTAREIIFKSALRSAAYSAISQSTTADAALVAVVNLQMIKDLVFVYGFRPSDARLVRIFGAVIRNSLIAYGLGSIRIGSSIARTVGDAAKSIPILGTAISVLVDSSVQGLTNGTLTTVIGYQTIRYLNKEYKLQNILDGIEVDETAEVIQEECKKLEQELKARPRGAAAGAAI